MKGKTKVQDGPKKGPKVSERKQTLASALSQARKASNKDRKPS